MFMFSAKENKSLIKMLNKSGPSEDPRGTYKSISVDLVKPVLGFALCHLLVK